jgi:glycosyltransferase involved in cell wall biosynthesis
MEDSTKPLVSIIIPCYNHGAFLQETIESVLKQTYQNFEIVVVNDGSPDVGTITLLKRAKWPKTQILHIENSGVSHARNIGIANSRGKYILPLDADDKLAESYLEKAVEILERTDITVVTSQVQYFGKKKTVFRLPEYSLEGLMGQNLLVCTSMFRRKDFEQTSGFNVNMKHGFEDWDFWLSLLKDGGKVHRIDEVLFYYRIRKNSRNASISLHEQATLRKQIYNNHIGLFSSRFFDPLLSFEYLNLYRSKEYRLGMLLLRPLRRVMEFLNV